MMFPDLVRAADLLQLPYTVERLGILFLNEVAYETPAIGVDGGGAPVALGDVSFRGACRTKFARVTPQPVGEKRADPTDLSRLVVNRLAGESFHRHPRQPMASLRFSNRVTGVER